MKLLLDTHTFMGWDSGADHIPPETLSLIQRSDTRLLVSLISFWEIQIKAQIGKLTLRSSLADVIAQQQTENKIILLPMTLAHILELNNLLQHHKDPFDRLLVAQCRSEAATLVSRDAIFKQYDFPVIW